MWKQAKWVFGAAGFLGVLGGTADASAQCCPGYDLATSCQGVTLTKSRWCVQSTVPTGNNATTLPTEFCSYGDQVVSYLELLFSIPAPSIFEFELDTQTGGAHTGTACNNFGDGVAYDAFKGGTSYYGWLLPLHEGINDWTGMSSGGWPTDWWADHISAFPNWGDYRIMLTIGNNTMNQNLLAAARAQYGNFWPGGSRPDLRVQMFDAIFLLPGFGFGGYTHLMQMQQGDKIGWDNLGVPNPDQKRSEYVLAYMSLAAGQNLLPMAQMATICNNVPDGTAGDATYTCQKSNVDAIATAHCSIKANGSPSADLASLDTGNYAAVKSGPCSAACTDECGCKTASKECVPLWLSDGDDGGVPPTVQPDAGGLGGSGSSGSSASGAQSGSSSGGSSGTGSGTSTSSGSGTSSGNSSSSGGISAGAGGSGAAATSGSATTSGAATASGAATSSGSAALGTAGTNSGGGSQAPSSSSGGCCLGALDRDSRASGFLTMSTLLGVAFARARSRRRRSVDRAD
jgi:hypothetical protein